MGHCLPRWVLSWSAITLGICFSRPWVPLRPSKIVIQSWYSSMSAPPTEHGYIEDIEVFSRYRTGGYHPVRINDLLHNKYWIVHKLGHGTFSTVWLAIDEERSHYVALKIGTANADRSEIDILSQLTQATASCCNAASNAQLSLIPVVLDRFNIYGPNGNHVCLVSPPARCSLQDLREASDSGLFQLDVARSLAAQLVMAVSLVHSHGYAHGDIHLGNILLQLPVSLNDLSVKQLYLQYGEPHREPVIRKNSQEVSNNPGIPPYVVPAVWLGTESDNITLREAKLMLNDFGLAFRPSEKSRFVSHTPLVLRPPEAFFTPEKALTLGSDIWSLGCVIFELLAHRSLIDGLFLVPPDEITAQQVELQGMMPQEWYRKWEMRSKWYDEMGMPLRNASDVRPWKWRFEQWLQNPRQTWNMETMSDQERDVLFKLLKWMLAWRPNERPDIKQVLETEWMTKWAIPAYQKGLKEREVSPV